MRFMAYKLRLHSRKQELKQPDEFIGTVDRLAEAVRQRQQLSIIAAMVLVVVLVGIAGWIYYDRRQDAAALTLQWEAERLFREAQAGGEGAPAAAPEQRFKAAADHFREIVTAYARTDSAPIAQYYLGNIQIELKDFAGAVASYQELIARYPREQALVELARLRLAYAFMAQGEAAAARRELEALAAKPDAKQRVQALFDLAKINQADGRKDEAIGQLQEIAQRYPDSVLAPEAAVQLRALGVTEPAPAAPTAEGAPAPETPAATSPDKQSTAPPAKN
jgi:TolA-binding protein